MYIHNYQIHNVLNAYRKQLSQAPAKASERPSDQVRSRNDGSPLKRGQPPAIVNQISTDIIDRITRFGPQSEFENKLADEISTLPAKVGGQKNADFTYTLIDEQNRKTTQTLQMQSLNTTKEDTRPDQDVVGPAKDQASGKALLGNRPKTPHAWKG